MYNDICALYYAFEDILSAIKGIPTIYEKIMHDMIEKSTSRLAYAIFAPHYYIANNLGSAFE